MKGVECTTARAGHECWPWPAISRNIRCEGERAEKRISADELKRIFLQTKASLEDGTHVQPVLAKQGAAHEAFVKTYLGKTDAALQTYYRGLVFTGKGSMPKTVDSDSEVVAYVTKTKGTIGYISGTSDAAGAKTLEVK